MSIRWVSNLFSSELHIEPDPPMWEIKPFDIDADLRRELIRRGWTPPGDTPTDTKAREG